MAARSDAVARAELELSITRTLKAPRSLVFKLWTRPEHLVRWWGPKDFTTTVREMDVRVGGTFRCTMRSPDGTDHTHRGVYREIVEPDRLVFTFAWEDEQGQPGHEMLVTVRFAEQDGQTTLTFHQAVFETVGARDSHVGGWSECFDRLSAYLASV